MEEKKEMLLKKFQKMLDDLKFGTVYRDRKKETIPTDILTMIIPECGNDLVDIMAEFFFLPKMEGQEEEAFYFNSVMTLTENLTPEMLPALYEAIALANYYAGTGAFAVNKEGTTLVYRNSIAFFPDTEEEESMKQMETMTSYSLNAIERFLDILFKVCDGRMSMEEFRELLPA